MKGDNMKAVVFKSLHPRIEQTYGLNLSNNWFTSLLEKVFPRYNKHPMLAGGSAVVEEEFIRKFMEYGTYDKYVFLCKNNYDQEKGLAQISTYKHKDRAEFILYEKFYDLNYQRVVLHGSYTAVDEMIHLRKIPKKLFWPSHGITHALSPVDMVIPTGLRILIESEEYDCITCSSVAGKKALEGIFSQFSDYLAHHLKTRVTYRGKLGLIPLAIDTNYYYPRDKTQAKKHFNLPLDNTVFLCLGRFSISVKMDIFPLIYHFSEKILTSGKKAILIFAGGQDFAEETLPQTITKTIEIIAKKLDCSQYIRVYHNLKKEDKALLYSAADVFVSPSDSVQETFGITILEAMASGLPVIASDWNGYRETIKHGKTGFLVPTYWTDSIEHTSQFSRLYGHRLTHLLLSQSVCVDINVFIKYMEDLYDNPDLRREMGNNARASVTNNYDWSCIIPKYEELWEELLEIAEKKQGVEQPILRHGLSSLDFLSIFRHYPSTMIREDDLLKITPMGYEFMNHTIDIYPLEVMDVYSVWSELNVLILNTCCHDDIITVADVIKKVSLQIAVPNNVIFHYLMRLVKYGILEITSDRMTKLKAEFGFEIKVKEEGM